MAQYKNHNNETEIFNKLRGVEVLSKEGMGIDEMLRTFKRKVERSGKLDEYKERQTYLKPSLKKRAKKQSR